MTNFEYEISNFATPSQALLKAKEGEIKALKDAASSGAASNAEEVTALKVSIRIHTISIQVCVHGDLLEPVHKAAYLHTCGTVSGGAAS